MKVCKEPTIRLQPAAQVGPPINLVDRLMGDDLLKQACGRIPTQLLEQQETRVEPRRQEVMEIGIDRL